MSAGTTLPGFRVVAGSPPPPLEPLRTDIAGFVGRSRRGTTSGVIRLAGPYAAIAELGPAGGEAFLGWSLRGYFANGGEIAYVRRVVGPGAVPAGGRLRAPTDSPALQIGSGPLCLARDPGRWANGGSVTLTGERAGGTRWWTWRVEIPGEPVELVTAIPSADLSDRLSVSAYVRPQLDPADVAAWDEASARRLSLSTRLAGGDDGERPGLDDYRRAAADLLDQVEVALVVLPDLSADLGPEARRLVAEVAAACDAGTDRLLLADLGPPGRHASDRVDDAAWISQTANGAARSVAAYEPWLAVDTALAGEPSRLVPPTGHVAGLASRLDREVGPGRTPANRDLEDVVDLAVHHRSLDEVALWEAHVNLLRCVPARGLQVWGGRTLDPGAGRFVAHRRLVHRLVRAFRRAALPLAFEGNGDEVRFALRRAVTSVLMQAHRSGALAGASPQESFEVRCDGTTTTAVDVAAGRLRCTATFLPADPIEHITIGLALGRNDHLEVSEL